MQFPVRWKAVWQSFQRHEKLACALFFCLALFALVFGVKSFGAHIRRPFELQFAHSTNENPFFLSEEVLTQEEQRQKTTDTDNDSLSDYDELFVYKTSPYLADSDSDQYSDQVEVASGNDPNCPVGKDCGRTSIFSVEEQGQTAQDLLLGAQEGSVLPSENLPPNTDILESVDDVETFLDSLTPDDIRVLLLQQGVPQETLDQLDDDALMVLFTSAIEESIQTDSVAE